jgi:hypothetical protein
MPYITTISCFVRHCINDDNTEQNLLPTPTVASGDVSGVALPNETRHHFYRFVMNAPHFVMPDFKSCRTIFRLGTLILRVLKLPHKEKTP